MSADLMLWLASLVGAITFFAAGLLIGRGPRTGGADARARAELEATIEGNDDKLAAALAEAEHLRAEVIRTEAEARRVADEAERLRSESDQRQRSLDTARAELALARDDTQAAVAERGRLANVLDQHRAAEAATREALARAEDQRGELEQGARKIRDLEGALENLRIERKRLNQRQQELEVRLKELDPEAEATLRHDLALARETARSNEDKVQRLEEANTALLRQVEAQAHHAKQVTALERENAELRMRVMAADLGHVQPKRNGVNGGNGNGNGSHPARPAGAPAAGGGSFQALVDKVGDLEPVRSAVIADELGLVVASHGTHGEELAAIGALFARSSSEARKVLPLDNLQRVILEDERNISVAIRPLRSFEGGSADTELTLVTLAVGTEPDPSKVTRILNDGAAPGARAQ
jgi:predicted nuclease with TOPRIM domain